jgi:hypothetical protein
MDTTITPRARGNRANTALAAAVDQALVVAIEHGARAAARFLEGRGAGFALTCRVPSEPGRRRASFDLLSPGG